MATPKLDDVFSFSTFDPSKFSESFRELAEKSVNQSKDAFAKVKEASEDATKTIEATLEKAQAGTVELGLKAIDAIRTNAESSFSHMEALLGVKSVTELFELQSAFARKQAEAAVEQIKSMQETSRKVAEEVSQPSKDAAQKVASIFKAA
ncbi:phasin [Rhizobium sp. C4]|uniref:phasin n=1 Tax=Rhizobium sp. C4 TaxID=1349800 RepID=UPI001E423E20|nr:phasin [Rhizobium sp. C4]MCD2172810.1 phasin [Rhizobium sp. C4]